MLKASIILPTYNRLERLKQVLHALTRQDCALDSFEVVIVSDGSTDGTAQYLQTLQSPLQRQVILQTNQGPAAARNQGIQAATGELVIFLDDDVLPSPQFVSKHIEAHAAAGNLVVIGPMLTPPDYTPSPWIRWMHARLEEQYKAMTRGDWEPTARQFYTGNASILRKHLLENGGFDPAFKRAEDVEFAYRLDACGLRFVFNPQAAGYHYEERSFTSWVKIPYAYGQNDVVMCLDKGQDWLFEIIQAEFVTRHPLIRFMVQLCIDRPLLSELTLLVSRGAGAAGAKLGADWMQRFAYSTIFNLHYYQGISDAIGGRRKFSGLVGKMTALSP